MFKIGIVENFHKDGIKLLENHPNFEYEIINDTSHKQKRLNKDDNFILVEERFFIPIIKWRGKNYYVFDVNNQILESQQMLAPFGNYITIKYK